MSDELFTSPIKEGTWSAACGGRRCCIEVAEVEGGGFALRNNQEPGKVIRASAEELRAFQALILGLID